MAQSKMKSIAVAVAVGTLCLAAHADSLMVNFTAALTPSSFVGPGVYNPFLPTNALYFFAQGEPDVLRADGQFYISNWDGSDGVFTTNVSPGTRFLLHSPLLERLDGDTWRVEGTSNHGTSDGLGNAIVQRDKVILPASTTFGSASLTIAGGVPVALSYTLDFSQPGVPGFEKPPLDTIPFHKITLDSSGASFGAARQFTIGVDDGNVAYGLNTQLSLGSYPAALLNSTVVDTTRRMVLAELFVNTDEIGGITPNISADGRLDGATFPASDKPVGSVYLQNPFLGESGTLTVFSTNDIIVGVSVVPEPQTYGLLLAGLGVVGWLARRRKMSDHQA